MNGSITGRGGRGGFICFHSICSSLPICTNPFSKSPQKVAWHVKCKNKQLSHKSHKCIFFSNIEHRKHINCLNWQNSQFYEKYLLILSLMAATCHRKVGNHCFTLCSFPSTFNKSVNVWELRRAAAGLHEVQIVAICGFALSCWSEQDWKTCVLRTSNKPVRTALMAPFQMCKLPVAKALMQVFEQRADRKWDGPAPL